MRTILFVADAASVHMRRWAETFRDLGHDVHVASFRATDIPGVRIHILPTFGMGKPGYFLSVPTLRKLANEIRPDVVHAHHITSYGFLSALVGLSPLVLTAWGSDVLIAPKQSKLMRQFVMFACKKADVITTVAQHMNQAVVDLGIAAGAVEAIPFGVDTERFKPRAKPLLWAPPLRVVCTRNFEPIYDVPTLIQALATVRDKGLTFRVSLVGDGTMRGEIHALVKKRNLDMQIDFMGTVQNHKLAEILSDSHIFVSPALSDGNNVSLNEAMACGCYPIATNIPANSQWIQHQQNGLLYEPGNVEQLADRLVSVITGLSNVESVLRENRNIIVERANWHLCVEKYQRVYEKAIRLVEARR